jgi:integrase
MQDPNRITVSVVAYPDRKHLMMRYQEPVTRKQVARSTGTTNRREAERMAAKWEAELREGRYRAPSHVSWSAFREKYEVEVVPSLAEKTGAMIGTVFNAVESILRPIQMRDLTADRMSYLQAQLRAGGRAEPTIRTYMAHLASALGWAVEVGLLTSIPKIQKPKRAKNSKIMKGRPITAEEFEQLLAKTVTVVGQQAADSWRHYLRGLWWSGLRLAESLELYWDRDDRLCVDLTGKRPMLRIPKEFEKGHQDRLLPITPEFAQFLLASPPEDRRGRVFNPVGLRTNAAQVDQAWVSRIVARIGKAAMVKVNTSPKTGKVKFASAHDLRRSFGERWSRLVMPQVLKELMRHESIETTMKYYVGHNAQLTAEVLWSAFEQRNAVRQDQLPDGMDNGSAAKNGLKEE